MTKALFLTVASPQGGGGHVLRCLALAESLKRHGIDSVFAVDRVAVETVGLLRNGRFEIVETQSAEQDVAALAPDAGVVIFDGYGFDSAVERRWRGPVRVVIDDLADRRHDCELLVDHAPGRLPEHYAALVPRECEILAGPTFALLRPGFPEARQRALLRRSGDRPPRRLLVALGLTDVGGITRLVVEGALQSGLGLRIDAVVGRGAASLPWLRSMSGSASLEVHVEIDAAEMAELMVQADMAIGSGGGASLERCCLGLPSLVILLAENQRFIVESLERAGAVTMIGGYPGVTRHQVAAALTEHAGQGAALLRSSEAAASIVDGEGADRVCQAILRKVRERRP